MQKFHITHVTKALILYTTVMKTKKIHLDLDEDPDHTSIIVRIRKILLQPCTKIFQDSRIDLLAIELQLQIVVLDL